MAWQNDGEGNDAIIHAWVPRIRKYANLLRTRLKIQFCTLCLRNVKLDAISYFTRQCIYTSQTSDLNQVCIPVIVGGACAWLAGVVCLFRVAPGRLASLVSCVRQSRLAKPL